MTTPVRYIPNPNYERLPGMTFKEQCDAWSLQKLADAERRENAQLERAAARFNIIERTVNRIKKILMQMHQK